MGKFRFAQWSHFADLWLGGMSSWAVSNGDGSRFLSIGSLNDAGILRDGTTLLPAGSTMLQPLSEDSEAAASGGIVAQAAEAPILWLLPEAEASDAVVPLGADETIESSATANFVTLTGSHITYLSVQPSFGLGGGLFIDADTRTILSDAEVSRLGLGNGDDDQLVLGGGTSGDPLAQSGGLLTQGAHGGAMDLGSYGRTFEQIVLLGGADYNLSASDGNVGAGRTLTVSALALGGANHLTFDGSAETSGRFVLEGGAGDDNLSGGHGADVLIGGAGADVLAGGAGADRFVYFSAAESTGANHDTLVDFTFGEDVIDLPVTVLGLDAAVTKGALSQVSFDADLSALLGQSVLEAGHALFFTPDSGALAGHTFLVVDANGEAGYQPGVDFVIEMPAPPPSDFHGTGFLV